MQRTTTLRRIATALMADPDALFYGYQLGQLTEIPSGVLYPTLARLVAGGMLTAGWESASSASAASRPRRRYYLATPRGLALFAELAIPN